MRTITSKEEVRVCVLAHTRVVIKKLFISLEFRQNPLQEKSFYNHMEERNQEDPTP